MGGNHDPDEVFPQSTPVVKLVNTNQQSRDLAGDYLDTMV